MSLDCIKVSDAVWSCIREDRELTEEELQHINACSSCADVLAEAQLCVGALNCVKPCPPAPDCRSAVHARVSNRRARFAPVWAYACVAIVIATMIGVAFLLPHSSRPVSSPDLVMAKAPVYKQPTPPLPAPEPKPEVQVHESKPQQSSFSEAREVNYSRHVPALHKHKTPPVQVVIRPVTIPVTEKPGQVVASPQDDTSALAYATWPMQNQPENSYNYSYTTTDPETGEVTSCEVKREGDSVEIKMEADPAESEMKPGKESKIDETVQCG